MFAYDTLCWVHVIVVYGNKWLDGKEEIIRQNLTVAATKWSVKKSDITV